MGVQIDDDVISWAEKLTVPKPPKPKTDDKDSVATVLDEEFASLGYPSTARLSILGDVGRENNWDRNTIFKGHSDPKNNAYNRGIISWQGDRKNALDQFLKQEKVYGRGDDNELRGMARFMDKELREKYPNVHKTLLNPKSTYDASEALRQYIKYVPDAPYNSPDPEFRVKNNATWAKRAKSLGLGQDVDLDGIWDQVDKVIGPPAVEPDIWSEVDAVLNNEPAFDAPIQTRPLQPDGQKPLVAPGQPLAPDPNEPIRTPVQAPSDEIDRSIYKGNLRYAPDTTELEKIGEAIRDNKEYEDNYEAQTRFNLEQIKNPSLTVENFNKRLKDEFDAERAIKERDFLEQNKDYAEWLKAAEKKDSHESRQEFNQVMRAAQPIAQQQVRDVAATPQKGRKQKTTQTSQFVKDTGRGRRAIPVPISEIPDENVDQYLTQKVGEQLSYETGFQPEIVQEFIKANKGTLLLGPPYTPEEIADYRDRGADAIKIHVEPGLVTKFRAFAENEAKERSAIEELRKRTAEGKGSLLTPEWEATVNKYAKWLMQSPFGPVRASMEAVTDEDRQRVIEDALTTKIKNAGSAEEALRLAKEYEAMGVGEKTFRFAGDIASAIGRSPATFARTISWLEDTTKYVREHTGIQSYTPTDILNAVQWMHAKIGGKEYKPSEQGVLPNLYADTIDHIFKQDPYTRDQFTGKLGNAVGSAVPFLLGAMATGGSSLAVGLLGAGMEVGGQYKQAKDAGLSKEKQLLAGLTGIPLGMSEMLGLKWARLGQLLQDKTKGAFLKGFTDWATKTGKEFTEESLQEYFQSAGGKVVIESLKNDGVTPEIVAKAIGGSLEDALTGGIVGILFGGGAPLIAHARAKKAEELKYADDDANRHKVDETVAEEVIQQAKAPKDTARETVELKQEDIGNLPNQVPVGEVKLEPAAKKAPKVNLESDKDTLEPKSKPTTRVTEIARGLVKPKKGEIAPADVEPSAQAEPSGLSPDEQQKAERLGKLMTATEFKKSADTLSELERLAADADKEGYSGKAEQFRSQARMLSAVRDVYQGRVDAKQERALKRAGAESQVQSYVDQAIRDFEEVAEGVEFDDETRKRIADDIRDAIKGRQNLDRNLKEFARNALSPEARSLARLKEVKKGDEVEKNEATPQLTDKQKPYDVTAEDFAQNAKVSRGNNWLSVKSPYDETSFVTRSLNADKITDEDAVKRSHKDYVRQALESGDLAPERARELGHFEAYPELAEKYGESGASGDVWAATRRSPAGEAIAWSDGDAVITIEKRPKTKSGLGGKRFVVRKGGNEYRATTLEGAKEWADQQATAPETGASGDVRGITWEEWSRTAQPKESYEVNKDATRDVYVMPNGTHITEEHRMPRAWGKSPTTYAWTELVVPPTNENKRLAKRYKAELKETPYGDGNQFEFVFAGGDALRRAFEFVNKEKDGILTRHPDAQEATTAPETPKTQETLDLHKDGIAGREIDAALVPNGNTSFQYAVGTTTEGGAEGVYRRNVNERGTYGGWRWETDVAKLGEPDGTQELSLLESQTPSQLLEKFRLKKPITGPSGAKLIGYEWKSKLEEYIDDRGEERVKRVSDWDESDTSEGTGRNIVHWFWIEHPDGHISLEGVNSAQNILGLRSAKLYQVAKQEQAAQAHAEEIERRSAARRVKAIEQTLRDAPADGHMGNRLFNKRFNTSDRALFDEAVSRSVVFEHSDGRQFRTTDSVEAEIAQKNGFRPVWEGPNATWFQNTTTAATDATTQETPAPSSEKTLSHKGKKAKLVKEGPTKARIEYEDGKRAVVSKKELATEKAAKTVRAAKAIAVPRSAAKRYAYADEVADQIATPEFKEAERQSATEKESSRTGFTKTQTEWLAKALQDYAKGYPEGAEYAGKSRAFNPNKDFTSSREQEIAPDIIAVPDDGVIRITDLQQANRLHQMITGKPIKSGLPKENTPRAKTNFERFQEETRKPRLDVGAVQRSRTMQTAGDEGTEGFIPIEEYNERYAAELPVEGLTLESRFGGKVGEMMRTTIKGKPAYTNGHFVLVGESPLKTSNTTEPDSDQIVKAATEAKDFQSITPLGLMLGTRGTNRLPSKIVFSDGSAVNGTYYNHIHARYPNATFKGGRGEKGWQGIVIYNEGQVVGVVMPVKGEFEVPDYAKPEHLRQIPDILTERGFDYEAVQDVARRVESGSAEIRYLNPEVERGRIAGGRKALEATIFLATDEARRETSSQGGRADVAPTLTDDDTRRTESGSRADRQADSGRERESNRKRKGDGEASPSDARTDAGTGKESGEALRSIPEATETVAKDATTQDTEAPLTKAEDFDQPSDYTFNESDYRPTVVEWAKKRWGAPDVSDIERQYNALLDDKSASGRRKALHLLFQALDIQPVVHRIDRGAGVHPEPDPESGAPLWDVTGNGQIYPEDVYSLQGRQYYGTGEDAMDAQAWSLIKSFEGKPNASVVIYRAVEKDSPSKGIMPGDWVTPVRAYATDHGRSTLKGNYRIQQKTVSARDIFTAGDSWLEWGYHPQPKLPRAFEVKPTHDETSQLKLNTRRAFQERFDVRNKLQSAYQLAPNGKPVWQNFVRWFGDSQVVNEKGEPKRMWHLTAREREFDTFKTTEQLREQYFNDEDTMSAEEMEAKYGNYHPDDRVWGRDTGDVGFYFSEKPDDFFGNFAIPVFLKAENPKRVRPHDNTASLSQEFLDELEEDGHDALTDGIEFVVFDPTQIKSSIGNTGNFSPDEGSILRQVPDEKNLIAAHNLSAANLRFADRMGGIALPSIAITSKDRVFEGFGDITLLADPSLIDPKRGVPVTDADMYSPRYPQQKVYIKDHKAFEKFWQPVKDNWLEHYPKPEYTSLEYYSPYEALKSDGVEGLAANDQFAAYYFTEKGIPLPPDERSLRQLRFDHSEDLTNFASEKIDELGGEYKYFKGWTPSGNKRLGDYNLETIVKHLKSEMKSGENWNYGAGNVRAAAAKRFKSIPDIQKDRGRMATSEEMEVAKDNANTDLMNLADDAKPHYQYDTERFGYYDEFSSALAEGLRKKRLRQTMEDYGWRGLDYDAVNKFLDELRSLPTEYFEAKPQRAVGLGEFTSAVIPDTLPDSARKVLEKHGLKIVEYKKGDAESRRKAVEDAARESNTLFKLRTPKAIDELDAVRDIQFDDLNDIKFTVEGNTLWMNTPQTHEVVRTLMALMGNTERSAQPNLGGLFRDPEQVRQTIDAGNELVAALQVEGVDTTTLEDLIDGIQEAANNPNKTMKFGYFDDSVEHEEIHDFSWIGANEKGRKSLAKRYDGAVETLESYEPFRRFHDELNRISNAQMSTGAAMEEALAYLGSGDYARFGLSQNEAVEILARLVEGYSTANGVESLKNFPEGTELYEAIQTFYEKQSGETSNDSGGELGSEREAGRQTSEGEPEEDAGETFTPGGPIKESKASDTLQKNNIPVKTRLYTSTTNLERQEFADKIMDKGIDEAVDWIERQSEDGNNNAGATAVVGINVMRELGDQGRIDELNKVADDVLPMLTDAAQTVQSFSVLSLYSPDTAVAYITKALKKQGKDITKEQAEKALEIARKMQDSEVENVVSQSALDDAKRSEQEAKAQAKELSEALGIARDANKTLKLDLSKAKATITRLKKSRVTHRTPQKVKEIRKRMDDVMASIRAAYGDVLRMVAGMHGISKMAPNRLGKQAIAAQMEKDGEDARTIYLATGWERGADGQWRNEIDDSAVKLTEQGAERKAGTLEEILVFPQLYKAYPELAKYTVVFDKPLGKSVNAQFSPDSRLFIINGDKSSLLHEVQHAVQSIEGFAKGGSSTALRGYKAFDQKIAALRRQISDVFDSAPSEFQDLARTVNQEIAYKRDVPTRFDEDRYLKAVDEVWAKYPDLMKAYSDLRQQLHYLERDNYEIAPDEAYRRLAGEVEARNVQTRHYMGPEMRKAVLISQTEDVSRDDQIVKYGYEILRQVPARGHDDLVDWGTVWLADNWTTKTPQDFMNELSVLTNGQLTENQLNDIHEAAVENLKGERAADPERAARARIRQSHLRAAQWNQLRQLDAELEPLLQEHRVGRSLVAAIMKQGMDNNVSDAAIWLTLARKAYPNVKDALREFNKNFDMPRAEQHKVFRASNELLDSAKQMLRQATLEKREESKLDAEDVRLIEAERKRDAIERSRIRREGANFFESVVKTDGEIAMEAFVNFRKANLLTGLKTHGINLSSTALNVAGEEVNHIPAWFLDMIASGITGERTVDMMSPRAIAQGLKNLVIQDETLKNSTWDSPEGKERAITAAKHILMYGGSFEDLQRRQHSEAILSQKFPNSKLAKWHDNYVNAVFRSLGVEDALFKVYAYRRSLETQASVIARSERRKDKSVDVKARRAELIRNPTNYMQARADEWAHFVTFQNDNPFSSWIARQKQGRPKTKAAVETFVPYDRTPTNVVLRALEWTPVGAAMSLPKGFRMLYGQPSQQFLRTYGAAVQADMESLGENKRERRKLVDAALTKAFRRDQQEQFVRLLSKGGSGSTIMLGGFFLAAMGLATGAMNFDDDDKKESGEAKKRRKEGIENGSILIPGVGRFTIPPTPAGMAFIAGATAYEQMRMSKKGEEMAAVLGTAEGLTDIVGQQPFLSSSYDLYRKAKRMQVGETAGSIASGYVPASSMVRQIAEVSDADARKGGGYRKEDKPNTWAAWFREQGRGFKGRTIAGLPIAREFLPVDEGAVSREERGGPLRRAVRSADIFNTRSPKTYEAPQPARKAGIDNYLKSSEFKSASTDDLVDILMTEEMPDSDRAKLKTALKKKGMNARKGGTLTPEESERMKKVGVSVPPRVRN